MKRSIIIITILLSGLQVLNSQDLTARLAAFRKDVLPGYSSWFSSADITQRNNLCLIATEKFAGLDISGRKELIDKLILSWPEYLIVVRYGTVNELWGWDNSRKEALFLDRWDNDVRTAQSAAEGTASKISKHPWFFYFGNMGQISSDKNVNIALNLRLGFFLLRDRWDLAASLSEQISGNIESDSDLSIQTNMGLMSKVYFPIKKYGLSPFAGAEAAISKPLKEKMSFSPSALAGVSWFIGAGSLDAGIKIGNGTMLMVGYTVIPNYRFKK